MSKAASKQFLSRGKIFWPIVLSLAFTAWMVYDATNTVHFQQVDSSGTHLWIDGNHNGVLDFHLEEDFEPSPKGDFKQLSISEVFDSLPSGWTMYQPLLLAFLFICGRDFFYMLRLRVLTKKRLSWIQCIRAIFMWEFASALSPGTVGGTAVAMFILEREGLKLGQSTALVVFTALLDNLFYLLFVPLVVFLTATSVNSSLHDLLPDTLVSTFWIAYTLIAVVCLGLLMCLFLFPNVPKIILSSLFKIKILKKWRTKALQIGDDLTQASRTLKKESKSYFFKAFASTLGSWLSRFLVINALFTMFFTLSWGKHLVLLSKQFVLWLLMLVSPTPGASGVAELGFQSLLDIEYSSPIILACLAILWRCFSYFPYLIIGALILPKWLHATRKKTKV